MLDRRDASYIGGMRRLSSEKRAQILGMLCEGMSLRAAERLSGCSFNTVSKILVDAGKACEAYHDEHVRGLTCKRIQCDDIWSFVYSKQKNVPNAKAAHEGVGDIWTWTAIDADSRLAVSWMVGGRDAEYANAFVQDIAERLANRVQLTTDGHGPYLEAVEGAFGADIDFAQLIKLYGTPPTGKPVEARRSPL